MNFITNLNDQNHKSALVKLIEWADCCILCTSYFDKKGLDHLLPVIKKGIEDRSLKVTIYSNGEKGYTKPEVIEKLSLIQAVKHIVIRDKRRFHTKLYYFKKADAFIAIVGSANLTHNGLVSNEELSIQIDGCIDSEKNQEILSYIAQLDNLNTK